MGAVWSVLPPSTTAALYSRLSSKSIAASLTQQGLSQVLWSLAVLKAPISLLAAEDVDGVRAGEGLAGASGR